MENRIKEQMCLFADRLSYPGMAFGHATVEI
jgi:hypothetical protein